MRLLIQKTSIILSTLLIWGSAFSQESVAVQLPTITPMVGDISTNISAIEIISLLPDSSFIGVIPSKIPNTRNNLVVSKGIQNMLQSFVNRQYSLGYNTSGKRILWSVYALSAGIDSSNEGNISFVKLGVNILKLENTSGSYLQLGRFDTVIVSNETKHELGKEIVAAINGLYRSTVLLVSNSGKPAFNIASSSLKLQPGVSHTSIMDLKALSVPGWQILTDSIYPQGVYMSFQEFKNNSPSIPNFITRVDTSSKQVRIYQFFSDSTIKLLPNAWGVSLRNELYIYREGQLYAIEKDGNGFSLSKYLDFRTRKNQGFFWRKMIGSQQGDINPFDDHHVYRIPIAIGNAIKIETTKIDSQTGELSF